MELSMNQKTEGHKINGTFIIGVIMLILTALALVPAFLSLNTKQAEVFYSLEKSQVGVPSTLDRQKIEKALNSNGIPLSTLELKIINQGNATADVIKVSANLPSDIMSIWTVPSKEDAPIWVDLPDIKGKNLEGNFRYTIKKLNTTKPLSINFGLGYAEKMPFLLDFERSSLAGLKYLKDLDFGFDENSSIQVFYDGIPAVRVDDVAEVPHWSKWEVFKLPAFVLGVGILSVLLWSFLAVLYSNPVLRKRVAEELILSLKSNW
jgi:hypothetical protein